MRDDTYSRLVAFISEQYWTPRRGFHPSTRITDDIGIDGDDGIELIQAIANEFDVDFTAFDPSSYFLPEGFNVVGCLFFPFRRFLSDKAIQFLELQEPDLRPLTLQALADCIDAGKWIDQIDRLQGEENSE